MKGYRLIGNRKLKLIRRIESTLKQLMRKGINPIEVMKLLDIPYHFEKKKWSISWEKIPTKKLSGINGYIRQEFL